MDAQLNLPKTTTISEINPLPKNVDEYQKLRKISNKKIRNKKSVYKKQSILSTEKYKIVFWEMQVNQREVQSQMLHNKS